VGIFSKQSAAKNLVFQATKKPAQSRNTLSRA